MHVEGNPRQSAMSSSASNQRRSLRLLVTVFTLADEESQADHLGHGRDDDPVHGTQEQGFFQWLRP